MDSARIKALDRAHHLHSWSIQGQLDPIIFDHGQGAVYWDTEGKRYLDFSAQLMNLNTGHQHPKIVKAIQEQAGKCCFVGPGYAYESRSVLVEKLVKITPDNINHFFFTLGGAEANENAIKMARLVSGKHKFISRYRSYHGATMGAISLTGDPRRWPAEPGIPGVIKVFDPYCYSCSFGLTLPGCQLRCVENIAEVMMLEGAKDHVAAIIVEAVTGSNGIFVPPEGYYTRLREICDEFNVLLIADEIMSGFGRTGEWLAIDNWDLKPDIVTMAKGLTSGYMPLGCVAISDAIADHFQDHMLWCGLTYNAHPLSCAAANACLEVYEEENLIQKARELGRKCGQEMDRIKERHACVGDARGIGLFRLFELVKDKATREPISPFNTTNELSKEITARLKAGGLTTFVHWNQLFVVPPLVITEEELMEGLGIIDQVLDYVDSQI
ncbi:MAG: aminotransferase class III-fold pyridoxal phosphate-dependent enzyme [Deltaproteobacteria bacterium]|nr:aminotransferase class III-fold pyridoxal phosphate-dependent enzyme [Deltaproteobacteria bacterium]